MVGNSVVTLGRECMITIQGSYSSVVRLVRCFLNSMPLYSDTGKDSGLSVCEDVCFLKRKKIKIKQRVSKQRKCCNSVMAHLTCVRYVVFRMTHITLLDGYEEHFRSSWEIKSL